MRRKRATPYIETAALQRSTATNPRKTLVATESRIDLHCSAHAETSAHSCRRGNGLRRVGGGRPRGGAGRGPHLRRALRAGGGAPRHGPFGGARPGGDDDA